MTHTTPADVWSKGDPYERYVGRWSRHVAPDFIAWLALPGGLRWLDVGCGTGALTAAIAERARPARLTGIDPSDGFLARARSRLGGAAEFRVAGAPDLPFDDGSFDAVVSGLALNFFPDASAALREMRRVATPGGTVAAYVWDYAGRMELMRIFWDAAVELDPAARALDEGLRFPLCRPDALRAAFGGAGFADVALTALDVATVFADFDDYWTPFLGGQGPAPSYVAALDGAARDRLRDTLRERLPAGSEGAIRLLARAWAVKGRVPAG